MLQSWAHAFSPDPDLRGVAEVYMDLKKKGVEFPVPSDEDLLLVQTTNKVWFRNIEVKFKAEILCSTFQGKSNSHTKFFKHWQPE